MDELLKLHDLYLLKEVERKTTVKERFESSAEHTYSCFILADYFLDLMGEKLDRGRVMQLLLYHDMVEIYAGDTFILDDTGRAEKKAKEHQALSPDFYSEEKCTNHLKKHEKPMIKAREMFQ